jgi:AhpD family alkylhydroperoxidase
MMGAARGIHTRTHDSWRRIVTNLYDPADRSFGAALHQHATPEYDAFVKVNQAVFGRTDGAISQLHRELIAVAVAVSKQCAFCIQSHTKNAAAAGATEAEIAEATMVAMAIGAGSAVTHGAMAMRMFGEASDAL